MADFFKILILILAIAFSVTIEYLMRKKKLIRVDTYSYKIVIGVGVRALLIAFIICFSLYLYSKSFEASLTLGIACLFFILGGCLRALLTEHHIKARGGRKE